MSYVVKAILLVMLSCSVASGMTVFMKNEEQIDAESAWRQGDTIYVQVNRDLLLDFPIDEVDLTKTNITKKKQIQDSQFQHQLVITRFVRAVGYIETLKSFARGYLSKAGASLNAEDAKFRKFMEQLVIADNAKIEPFLIQPFMRNLTSNDALALAEFFESSVGQKIVTGAGAMGVNPKKEPSSIVSALNFSEEEKPVLLQFMQSSAYRKYGQLVARPEFSQEIFRSILQSSVFDGHGVK